MHFNSRTDSRNIVPLAHCPAAADASSKTGFGMLFEHFGDEMSSQSVAIWARNGAELDNAALMLIQDLVFIGVDVHVHLPAGVEIPNCIAEVVNIHEDKYQTAKGCDALVISSDAKEYVGVEPGILSWHMVGNTVFDVKDCLQRDWFEYSAFELYTSGRAPLLQDRQPWAESSLSGEAEEGRLLRTSLLPCA